MNENEILENLDRLKLFGAADLIRQQQAEINKLNETVDKLLNHCDDPECWECGKIICPYGGEMHFHHDGCPTCAEMDSGMRCSMLRQYSLSMDLRG